MSEILSDLRFAARTLRSKPVFTCIAVASLALGIGANTAIFSVVESALLRGLPYRDSAQLISLRDRQPCCEQASLSPGEYLDYQKQTKTLSGLAAATWQSLTLTGRAEPQKLIALAVTTNYFQVLGTQAEIGRLMSPEIDKPGADTRVAILSDATWRSTFGSDPNVIGRDVTLNGNSFRIVGVLKAKQGYPGDIQVWISPRVAVPEYVEGPMTAKTASDIVATYGDHWLFGIGRMRPGVTPSRARAELETIASRIAAQHPNTKDHHPALFPLQDMVVREVRPALWVLLTAVILLLLIACANLAGLLLARATGRTRELAVRISLGASRWQIVRLMLSESLLLAVLGGGFGIFLAQISLELINRYSPYDLPAALAPELNFPVLAFCTGITLFSALISGMMPALRSIRTDVNSGLKEGSKGSATGTATRLRQVLVSAEIAVSVMLLTGASLLIHSFSKLIAVDPGYNATNVLSARLSLPETRYPGNVQVAQLWQALLQRTAALPDVESAGLISDIPMAGSDSGSYVEVEGHPASPDHPGLYVNEFSVSPGIFQTLRIPLIAGRVFDERDNAKSLKVAVVNQRFAAKAFPKQNPIGKRFRGGPVDGWFTVIGVAGDIRHSGLSESATPDMFFDYPQWSRGSTGIEVRTRAGATSTAAELRKVVHDLDPQLPLTDVKPLGEYIGGSLAARRFLLGLLSTFSVLAIVLAGIGLYAVLAYSVEQRKREIGIRMALGAQGTDVLWIVARECSVMALIGVASGLVAAFWSSSLMKSMLFGVAATDLFAYAAAVLFILAIATAAASVPAFRAVTTDPVTALRYE